MSAGRGFPRWLGAAASAAAVLLAACTAMQGEEVSAPPQRTAPAAPAVALPRERSDAELLISYFTRLRTLPGPDLAREHDSARQAYGSTRSDYNRVRLAMIVTLQNTPFHDDSRALDLLEPLANGPDSRLSGLAALLVSQIQERQRLDASAQALQQKLDALKALERSLSERKR